LRVRGDMGMMQRGDMDDGVHAFCDMKQPRLIGDIYDLLCPLPWYPVNADRLMLNRKLLSDSRSQESRTACNENAQDFNPPLVFV